MIKNIIFDWSGTLSDDFVPVYLSTMVIFKKLGLKKLTPEQFRNSFVLPYMEFFRKYTPKASRKIVDETFLTAYSTHKPRPFPEAKETLNLLKERGIKMVIMSSLDHEKLQKELKEYGFQKFFLEVNGSVHDKRKIINKIIIRNKLDPKETAYIGDMEHDMDAGKKAGIMTIAVSYGYQSKEKLSKRKPDFIIDSLKELESLISARA
jgi:phosphoglycolate phosphatase